MQYRVAEEVRMIAQPIIADHHRHLVNTRIEFLFSDSMPTRGGSEVWATSRKISGLASFLASEKEYPKVWIDKEEQDADGPKYPGPVFVMVVSSPIWSDLSLEQKRALVDHELCHMFVSEETDKLSIQGHFIEEFPEVLKRHGLWNEQTRTFSKASREAEQLSLEDTEDESSRQSIVEQATDMFREQYADEIGSPRSERGEMDVEVTTGSRA